MELTKTGDDLAVNACQPDYSITLHMLHILRSCLADLAPHLPRTTSASTFLLGSILNASELLEAITAMDSLSHTLDLGVWPWDRIE